MHVRRPALDGLGQHLVDELDDRGVLGRLGKVHVLLPFLVHDFHARVDRFRHQRLERVGPDAQEVLQAAVDLDRTGQHASHVAPAHQAQLVQPGGIGQLAAGDQHRPVLLLQRHQAVRHQDAGRKLRQELARGRLFVQVHKGHVQLPRKELEDVLLGQTAGLDHRLIDGVALGDHRLGQARGLLADQPLLQHFCD